MSKAQFILLAAVVGFYAVLTVMLFVGACARYFQTKRQRAAVARCEKISRGVVLTRGRREWTRAVWHGNPAH